MDFDFDFDFDFDGDGGGLGWVLPAVIFGRLMSNANERQKAPAGPSPAPQTVTVIRCAHCQKTFDPAFTFCPHCGQSTARHECRYCGRENASNARACIGCGAPVTAPR